ncbi:hypothetical protein KUH03_33575 [Sphingobacterium sp. E70]|uniref:hypothetical protein n=1 Tax=Sphingobacterium sp. E70 TaxID=2853439 RepID=UPI00211CF459|nr:hypothetical protein [Sphingobacterium sp. E70]ULT23994.1 hypothetical protein KUH03_33575 [Sphingobacterium sp. E70]
MDQPCKRNPEFSDCTSRFYRAKSGTFTVIAKDKAGKTIATRTDIKLVENYYYSLILIGKANDEKNHYTLVW